ncbi:zinc carboxypeptidase-like [Anticarsia gemmatalis]|uniref:zinc carboxypeptidase-like n=1 Tax=Anticarsia gemmatalis TaxID=129554 RepID=UPI003F7577D6
MIFKTVILAVLVVLTVGEQVKYDDYALYKVYANTEDHVKFLNELNDEDLQIWKLPSEVGDYASIVAPPEKKEDFIHTLKKRSIHSELMLENIQEAFDAQLYSRRKRDLDDQLYWTNYQEIEDIYRWFDYLTANYGDIVTQVHVGTTAEGRNITGIRIARGSGTRVFVLQAGEVAADWLSPTVVTYFADQLIRSNNSEVRAAAEEFVWYIFPMVNIDGHQFTLDSVRLWLKNRRRISSTAIGVDLTKNWNSHWGVSGGSFVASANNYIGLGPFSEPETRAVSEYIVDNIGRRLTGYLNFRSFGQRIVIPFAHTDSPMYNYNEMVTIARRAMGSLAVRYNTQYLVGNSRSVHDGATGAVIDWVKHRFNPPIAATYLLRDTGAWGYTLPVVQITPTCEETFDSLLAIIREARFINAI